MLVDDTKEDGDSFMHMKKKSEELLTRVYNITKQNDLLEDQEIVAKRLLGYNPNNECVNEYSKFHKSLEYIKKQETKYLNIISRSQKTNQANNKTVSEAYKMCGHCRLIIGDFFLANNFYRSSYELCPESKDPYFWYGFFITCFQYNFSFINICFHNLAKYSPSLPLSYDICFRLAIIYRDSKDYPKSIAYFNNAKSSSIPGLTDDDINMQIGLTYQYMKQYDRAREIYEDLYKKYPNNSNILEQYSWFLFLYCGTPEDYDIITKIIDSNPNLPSLLLLKARLALRKNDLVQAFNCYNSANEYFFCFHHVWCGMGEIFFKTNQIDASIECYQKSLYLKDDHALSWLNLGFLFEQLGQKNAENVYKQGANQCSDRKDEFERRINEIITKGKSDGKLLEIEDSMFFSDIPQKFAYLYVHSVPIQSTECFGPKEPNIDLLQLSLTPKSLFA